jgi:hypothetical protein
VLYVPSIVTVIGAAGLALLAWVGAAVGLRLIKFEEVVDPRVLSPAAINLFALMFFLIGITTLASAADRFRWRTIGIIGGFYAVEAIVRIVATLAPGWQWLNRFTFFTPFNPQLYVADPDLAWMFYRVLPDGSWQLGGLGGHAVLIGIGLACFVAAGFVFAKIEPTTGN